MTMKPKHIKSRSLLTLLLTLYFLLPVMVYAKDNPVKFTITWPTGWQVAEPEERMIGSAASYLVAVTKLIDDEPKAFFLVHEIPIDFKGDVSLRRLLNSIIRQQKSALKGDAFDIKVVKKRSLKLNGHNALEASLLIKNNETIMTQRLITVLTGKKAYGITIIIIGDDDKAIQKEIKDSLATLELF